MWLGKQARDNDFATLNQINDLDRRLDALEEIPTSEIKNLLDIVKTLVNKSKITNYLLAWGPDMASGYRTDSIARRGLSVKNGVGIIHLDFITTRASGNNLVATLPDDAPTFEATCDVNLTSGGHVWINKGSREVMVGGMTPNTRIIVDIIGFVNQ